MDDWKVGDLALCVAGGRLTRAGGVYRVFGVLPMGAKCGCGNPLYLADVALLFEGMSGADARGCRPWASSSRFRKIHKLTDEEREDFAEDLRIPDHDRLVEG